jgi:hypothetical protein
MRLSAQPTGQAQLGATGTMVAFVVILYYSFRVQGGLSVMSGFATLSIIRIDLHCTKQRHRDIHMMNSLIGAIVQLWYKPMSTLC